MDSRKEIIGHVLASRNEPNSWRTSLMKCLTIILVFPLSPNCSNAQCPTSTVSFVASTNPHLLFSPDENDISCSWRITSPVETGRIRLRVVQDYYFSCCCQNHYLLIKDGSDSYARSIAILCSELNPVTLTSSGPDIYGEFHSNGDERNLLGYAVEFDYFDSNVSCPSGWIGRDIYCYRLYNDTLPWQQAASRCGYDGGFLTSIEDDEENDFIVDSFRNETTLAWIGLDANGNWLDRTRKPYNNFTNGSPSYMDCALIDLEDDGRWKVSDCVNQQLPFICKKTQDGTGGRYWTDVIVSNKEDESLSSSSLIVGGIITSVIIGTFFCFVRRSSRANRSNRSQFCENFCTCLCEGTCACIAAVGHCVGRGIESCRSRIHAACTAARNSCPRRAADQSEETEVGGTPTNMPQTYESRVSLEEVEAPTEISASAGSIDQSNGLQPPPSYGDAISTAPPPSYSDALEEQAAPSYESVVVSETNQTQ